MKQKSVISSLSNAQMKNLILLQKKAKARTEQGVYVIEGLKMFEEAKEAGNILVKTYVSESFYDTKIQECSDYFAGVEYEIVTDFVFNEVSETKTPQGVMAIVTITSYPLEAMLESPNACLLLLEDVRDPGNLGTILRTAEGAGVTGIIMNRSCVDLYNPKVIRSTMGSIFRVPFYQAEDFHAVLLKLKNLNIHIFAAHLSGKAYDSEGGFQRRCAILIGNEANGLSEEVSKMADTLIKIPMAGKVESLNVAVAAAILMYEVARQRKN